MSVANQKKGDETERNSLVVRSISAIAELEPLVFVIENVPSFINTECTGVDGTNRPIGEEIERVLGGRYEYLSRIHNLQDYGSPSSRKRSITIGVRNDLHWVSPLDLWPEKSEAPTLRSLIGDLESLTRMGQVSSNDPFHNFRSYDPRMRPWIERLEEGHSAFDNSDPARRPHRIIDGKMVPNARKNGDKYKRVFWDRTAPCVHTRTDILASQNTIHPQDDRVFSVRELMRMMGLPDDFVWFDGQDSIQDLAEDRRYEIVRKNEPNIRQCLGEAVPVPVMRSIGNAIVEHVFSAMDVRGSKVHRKANYPLTTKAQTAAYRSITKERKRAQSAYYTQPLEAFSVTKRALGNLGKARTKGFRILEPSVGGGIFVVTLSMWPDLPPIDLTVVDLDASAVSFVKSMNLERLNSNLKINYQVDDYLSCGFEHRFDLALGNPPFGRVAKGKSELIDGPQEISIRFLIKSLSECSRTYFVFPKAFLHASAYEAIRNKVRAGAGLRHLIDFGEAAFPDVKVETIALGVDHAVAENGVQIKSWIKSTVRSVDLAYIAPEDWPTWMIYRDALADSFMRDVSFGRFSSWRDRRLSRKFSAPQGIRVIRGRNLSHSGSILKLPDDYSVSESDAADTFDSLSRLTGRLFLAPNLSYSPRTVEFNANTTEVPDGSCAVLSADLSDLEAVSFIEFASSSRFESLYRIACNYATRSINIDSCLSFWWGVPEASSS